MSSLSATWIPRALRLPAAAAELDLDIAELPTRGWQLLQADAPLSIHPSFADAYDALMHLVCAQTVDAHDAGLAMHAACVAWKNAGILIPGVSGAGKTTLTAWLLLQGCSYLTDELTLAHGTPETLGGWGRPLRVKNGSLPRVSGWAREAGLLYRDGAFLPAEHLGAPTLDAVAPRAILFLERGASGGAAQSSEVSRGLSIARLCNHVVNGRRLPRHGLDDLKDLTRRARGFVWRYTDVEQLGPLLKELLATQCR